MNTDQGNSSPIKVVAVDDDLRTGKMITKILGRENCRVQAFTDPAKCLAYLKENDIDIVITDIEMPDIDGITVLRSVKEMDAAMDVIIVTGHAEKAVAIDALRLGAFDLLEKPFDPVELIATIKRTVRYRSAIRERDLIAEQLSLLANSEAERWGIKAFVGRSEAFQKVIKDIMLLQKTENTSILITGESGTGKELVARAIHFGSEKSDHPFVPVNSSAVPAELAESVLFGHLKGSFTGASADKKGAFDMANGGTLFLDEIGDMSPEIQTKLLRVLEDGMIIPIGKATGHEVNIRVIAATNANLEDKIEDTHFRSDLYYRLAAYVIHLPPLRERKEDIPALVDHFASACAADMNMPAAAVHPDVYSILASHDFPGNIRELRNMMERALIECAGKELQPQHFRAGGPRPTQRKPGSLPLNLKELEAMAVERAMQQANGNVSAAARLLGVSRTRLYRKLPQT